MDRDSKTKIQYNRILRQWRNEDASQDLSQGYNSDAKVDNSIKSGDKRV